MRSFSLSWAAQAIGATAAANAALQVRSVSTDTRELQVGALFFALEGENVDGHRYVAEAFRRGAVAAVVSRSDGAAGGPLLCVSDPLRALGDLAAHYRAQFAVPVVGVTGSVGKTSTRDLITAALSPSGPVLASERNFNTEIGVPLGLFRLESYHRFAALEFAMRGMGQIDRLAEIAQPTAGVITNVGVSHIELLGSQERIAEAKSELLARLPADGLAVLPRSDAFFDYLAGRVPRGVRIVTFARDADARADVAVEAVDGSRVTLRVGGTSRQLTLRAVGTHHAVNAAAAIALVTSVGADIDRAIGAIERWPGAEGRMIARSALTGQTILDDCYNAAPDSMEAALRTLATWPDSAGCRVAILGEMRELGPFAGEAHKRVGRMAAHAGLRLLVAVGEMAAAYAEAAVRETAGAGAPPPEIERVATTDEAIRRVPALLRSGDVVLIKGSRALCMERLVDRLAAGSRAGG